MVDQCVIKENLLWCAQAADENEQTLDEWLADPGMLPEPSDAGQQECVAFAWGYLQGLADAADRTLTKFVASYDIDTTTLTAQASA